MSPSPPHLAQSVRLVLAPSNLGLRPLDDGSEPGTWRAPAVLARCGMAQAVGAHATVVLDRPRYDPRPQPGTRIRNGQTLRAFSLELGAHVAQALDDGCFPVVLGGDCGILLGCLFGARQSGPCALVHVDGHSDFAHPGSYDTLAKLGSVAGMDLALATGRGEALLTDWPGLSGPLVPEHHAIQIGERDGLDPDFEQFYAGLTESDIRIWHSRDILIQGMTATAEQALAALPLGPQGRIWIHVDLDVLDQSVMPAVDSPGSPGLDFAQLTELLGLLCADKRTVGLDVAIYDPDLDPEEIYARRIVECIGRAVTRRVCAP